MTFAKNATKLKKKSGQRISSRKPEGGIIIKRMETQDVNQKRDSRNLGCGEKIEK